MEVSGQFHAPCLLTLRKETRHAMVRGIVEPQKLEEAMEKIKISSPCLESNPDHNSMLSLCLINQALCH
jgi:hypothetical protein